MNPDEYGRSAEDAAYDESFRKPPVKMPNRAARRQAKKKGFGEALSEFAQRAKDAQQQQGQPQGDDLNVLPLPATQDVIQDCMIVWKWPINNSFEVVAVLYTKDTPEGNKAGDYEVELGAFSTINFSASEEAKFVGQALISAWNYQNIWKLHAGEFMERQLMQPANARQTLDDPCPNEWGTDDD